MIFGLIVVATFSPGALRAAGNPVLIHGVLLGPSGRPASSSNVQLKTLRGATIAAVKPDGFGRFTLSAPSPGIFRLVIASSRAKRIGEQTIRLPAAHSISLSIHLEPSGAGFVVHVAALDSVSSSQASNAEVATEGGELSSRQVSSLPLNGRDFSQLLHLVAGTMTDTNGAADFTQQFAVNGQRGTTAVFATDGVYTSDPEMGGAALDNFNVDAIEEVRSETGVLPAEIGAGAASYTDVITKRGTAEEHGDIFEFVRNSAFDARNFFDRRTLVSPGRLPQFERNEFGLTNGGPLVIPGLYNGRDKTWYFGEYQGFRQLQGTTQVVSVPTAAERMGVDTTAFPGDTLVVPVSPFIRPVLARYPEPNDPSGPFGLRTYAASAPVVTNSDQFSLRVDHRASDKSYFFGRFTLDNISGPLTNPDQSVIDPSFAIDFSDHERNVAFGNTRILSPHLTMQTRLGFIRATPDYPTLNTTQPALDFGDGLYEPFNAPAGSVMGEFGNLYQFRQDWTEIHGSHTFKFGGQFRWNVDATVYGISPNGQFQFGGGTAYATVPIESGSGKHNIAVGQPLPDALSGFLSGTPYSYTSAVAYPIFPQGSHIGESAIRRQAYDLYFQDSWKATRHLMVDYGLRYEVETPIYEIHDLTSESVWLGSNGQETVPWAPGAREEMLFNPRPAYPTDWNGWGPRLNLTFRASKRTMLHAGGGMVTILTNLWQDNFLTGGMPIVLTPYITAAPGAPVPFENTAIPLNLPPIYTPQGQPVFGPGGSEAVPANTVMDVARFEQDLASATPGGQPHPLSVNSMARNFRNGDIATYSAGIEHQFSDFTLDADYVATMGIHLPRVEFPNAYGGASPAWAPFTTFNPSGEAVGGYGPESVLTNGSHSTYHSLQASLSKTSARAGLGFQVSYTYSKALDDTSSVLGGFSSPTLGTILQAFPQDPRNPGAEKGPSDFDLAQVLSFSLIQRLPFQRIGFLRSLGAPVTTGWEVLSVSSFTSGAPFSVFSGIQQTGAGTSNADRPDEVTRPVFSTSGTVREDYFGRGANNASYFRIPIDVPGGTGPNDGRFGTLGRNTFWGPGYAEFDGAVIKDTPLGRRAGHEAVTLEFRAEFFNVFNTVNFANPANIVQGSGFGYINHTSGPSRQLQFSLKLIY